MCEKCQKFDSDLLRQCLPFWGQEKVQTASEHNDLFASEQTKKLLFGRNPVAIKTPKFLQSWGISVNDGQAAVLLLWA